MVPRLVGGLRFDDTDEPDGTKQLLLPCLAGRRLVRQRAGLPRGVSVQQLADGQLLRPRFSRRQDGFLTFGFLPFYLLQGLDFELGFGLDSGFDLAFGLKPKRTARAAKQAERCPLRALASKKRVVHRACSAFDLGLSRGKRIFFFATLRYRCYYRRFLAFCFGAPAL